jgi:hypothetical protein
VDEDVVVEDEEEVVEMEDETRDVEARRQRLHLQQASSKATVLDLQDMYLTALITNRQTSI